MDILVVAIPGAIGIVGTIVGALIGFFGSKRTMEQQNRMQSIRSDWIRLTDSYSRLVSEASPNTIEVLGSGLREGVLSNNHEAVSRSTEKLDECSINIQSIQVVMALAAESIESDDIKKFSVSCAQYGLDYIHTIKGMLKFTGLIGVEYKNTGDRDSAEEFRKNETEAEKAKAVYMESLEEFCKVLKSYAASKADTKRKFACPRVTRRE